MKEIPNMTHLFTKLDDLKKVFDYGQKIIPVLASLIDFMRDTVPLLENVNASIAESTRQIPRASHHISDVTRSTELATTEILDIVDVVSKDIGGIENSLKRIVDDQGEKIEPAVSGELMSTIDSLKGIRNNVFNITLSLQVQDITSQQLAAVNHLIEAVQEKLSSLVDDIQRNELKDEFKEMQKKSPAEALQDLKIKAPEDSAFNPGARYVKSDNNQRMADSLINNRSEKTSQDEIDKLFS